MSAVESKQSLKSAGAEMQRLLLGGGGQREAKQAKLLQSISLRALNCSGFSCSALRISTDTLTKQQRGWRQQGGG